jgi:hypothetical protein
VIWGAQGNTESAACLALCLQEESLLSVKNLKDTGDSHPLPCGCSQAVPGLLSFNHHASTRHLRQHLQTDRITHSGWSLIFVVLVDANTLSTARVGLDPTSQKMH